MTKKEKVLFIKEYFDRVYADAECTLDYKTPFELMIATILAAQCTDARVNIVTKDLFKKYPDVYAFASADLKELEQDIRSTGFYHNKAKNIIACAQKLISDFSGEVPDTMDELLTLAGVGRKTANLILGDVFGKPAIVVDTHAKRITNLIGLTNNTDPTKIEMDLKKVVPPDYGSQFCHCLVYHGRAICIANRPKCNECGLIEICKYGGSIERENKT